MRTCYMFNSRSLPSGPLFISDLRCRQSSLTMLYLTADRFAVCEFFSLSNSS